MKYWHLKIHWIFPLKQEFILQNTNWIYWTLIHIAGNFSKPGFTRFILSCKWISIKVRFGEFFSGLPNISATNTHSRSPYVILIPQSHIHKLRYNQRDSHTTSLSTDLCSIVTRLTLEAESHFQRLKMRTLICFLSLQCLSWKLYWCRRFAQIQSVRITQ